MVNERKGKEKRKEIGKANKRDLERKRKSRLGGVHNTD